MFVWKTSPRRRVLHFLVQRPFPKTFILVYNSLYSHCLAILFELPLTIKSRPKVPRHVLDAHLLGSMHILNLVYTLDTRRGGISVVLLVSSDELSYAYGNSSFLMYEGFLY